MEGSVTVKAYLEKPGQSNAEIRRFDVDQEVSTSFEYLRSKLASIYPDLSQRGFYIYWKDDENDMVAISSDEELIQAMIHGRPNGILRLYIKSLSDGSPSPSGGSAGGANVEHPGVVCDGCDGAVRGLRFKCLVCPDYDLCSTCCDRGVHNHHYLLRLATPASDWPGCGRRAGGPGRHGPAGNSGWWWPGFGGYHGGHHGGWAPGANMRRLWRNLMRNQQTGCEDGESTNAQPNGETPQSAAADADTSTSDAEREQQKDYLHHIGEQVSALLEPLGVSVDVEVEERLDGQEAKCNKQNGDLGRCQGQFKGQGKRLGGKGRQCYRGGRCKPAADCTRQGACSYEQAKPKGPECARGGKCKPADDCPRQGASSSENPEPKGQCARGGECQPADNCAKQGACGNEEPKLLVEDEQLLTSTPPPTSLSSLDSRRQNRAVGGDEPHMDVDVDSGEDASWIKVESKPEDMEMISLEPATSIPAANSNPKVLPAVRLYPSLTTLDARPKERMDTGAARPEPSAPAVSNSSTPTTSQRQEPAAAPTPKSELDTKVSEAIEQMRAMGFHDDGGWMTAMLYENNGDVYKVIDSVLRAAQANTGKHE